MVKYLEFLEKYIHENSTIFLLLFNICLLIILYIKYHKTTMREGNKSLQKLKNKIEIRKRNIKTSLKV